MARTAAAFKQADLVRAVKGAQAAGIVVARVRIAKDGAIEIDTSAVKDPEADNPFDKWKASRADKA